MTNPNTYDPNTHKVVPVNSVVLNPASGVVWEFLNAQTPETLSQAERTGYRLAQELRKQLPKPRIDEPGWGVIVEAGVKQHDERLRWIRLATDAVHRWSCEDDGEYDRAWDDLVDPQVVTP